MAMVTAVVAVATAAVVTAVAAVATPTAAASTSAVTRWWSVGDWREGGGGADPPVAWRRVCTPLVGVCGVKELMGCRPASG